MNRQEFDKPTRRKIIQRACINGIPTCERVENGVRCACTKGLEVHHKDMDAMKLDKSKPLTADEGELICKPHHKEETAIQVSDFAKANHVRDRALGVDKPKKGFARVSKTKEPLRVAAGDGPGMSRRFVDV